MRDISNHWIDPNNEAGDRDGTSATVPELDDDRLDRPDEPRDPERPAPISRDAIELGLAIGNWIWHLAHGDRSR